MKARLLILLVAAIGLAVFFATRSVPSLNDSSAADLRSMVPDEIKNAQVMLRDLPLPGEEPPDVDLSIQVEVNPADAKNRLYYYITEAHDYYVEQFEITFYYKPTPDTVIEDSPLRVPALVDEYLKAGETFEGCIEVVPAELGNIGGEMGMSENWDAELTYDRARAEDPDPLPPDKRLVECN